MSEGRRPIRSFVRREGRLTAGQARALDELLPELGLPYSDAPADLDDLFGRSGSTRVLEIGFGNGEATAELARRHPDWDILGIEVHRPGVGHLLLAAQEHGLWNLRVSTHDAVEVLRDQLPERSLDRIHIWFPDPWPKTRHHKRRIIRPDFVELLGTRLKPGGVLHLATDWAPYAERMLEVMEAVPGFRNTAVGSDYCPRPESRPETHFERRGLRKGHQVYDLIYDRPSD